MSEIDNEIKQLNQINLGESTNPRVLIRHLLKGGSEEELEKLTKQDGCDLEYADEQDGRTYGKSVLAIAVKMENSNFFEILLNAGCHPDSPKAYHKPIVEALLYNKWGIAKALINAGCRLDVDQRGKSLDLLHIVCSKQEWSFELREIIEILIQKGCDINQADGCGRTPLTNAVQCSHEGMIRLLLEKGASIDVRTDFDGTLLHHALMTPNGIKNTPLLLEVGCEKQINVRDGMGRIPLHNLITTSWAHGADHVMRMLIGLGADYTTPNNNGISPLKYMQNRLRGEHSSRWRPAISSCCDAMFDAIAMLQFHDY